MYNELTRPAWIEVNLDKFKNNIVSIKNILGSDVKIMSIIKSDAYMLGSSAITQKLLELGIDYVGVATLSEAISIRKQFKNIDILILGYNPTSLMKDAIIHNITSSIYNLDMAKKLNDFARLENRIAKIHIPIDTGMHRLGYIPSNEALDEILEIAKLKNIEIEGAFTHFPDSDNDEEFTLYQVKIFEDFIKVLEDRGVNFKYLHVSNSAAILKYGSFGFNMARPGIITYGFTDNDDIPSSKYNLSPIVEVKSEISQIKYIDAGDSVGYGRIYMADKKTKIATIPIGYSDGFLRSLSEKIFVLVNGIKCRQIGMICMDQLMIDVSSVNCKIGDEVVLIGSQAESFIELNEVAKLTSDVESSFLTHFSRRLPIVYLENGKVKYIEDAIRG